MFQFMSGCVFAPFQGSPGLILYFFVCHFGSALCYTKELGRFCFRYKVRFVGRIARIVNPKVSFGWLEPLQHFLVTLKDHSKPALRIRAKLLNPVPAFSEPAKKHLSNVMFIGHWRPEVPLTFTERSGIAVELECCESFAYMRL